MADKRDILIRLLGEETVSRMAGKAGDGLDKFGDKLDATEKDAHDLDRQIGEVERDLKLLAVAFSRTGDAADRMDISKAMRKQQAELRKLTKAKDLLPDFGKAGEEAASGFGASFVARIGPLLAKAPMGGVGAGLGAIIAVPLVATVGAAVAGAVVGGVGIGGVVGGIALAAKDARVQAAGKDLSENVMGDLEDSASRFVDPTIRGIQIIGDAWNDVAGDVDGIFAATARYVEPLARGVAGAVKEIAPGLRDAAEAAGPIIQTLAEDMPRVGRAIGDLFSTMADHADEGASAIHLLMMGLEGGIDVTAALVGGLADIYEGLVIAGTAAADFSYSMYGWMPIVGDKIADNRDKMHELKNALDKGGDAGGTAGVKIAGGMDAAARATRGEASALDELAIKLRAQTDPTFALIDAQHGLRDAQKEYNAAVKEHGKNSPEAQEALRKSAAAALTLEAAVGGAAGTFNGQLSPAMVATLKAAGFTDAQIADLEQQFKTAKAAGDKFAKNYQASAALTDMATAKARAIRYEISKIHGKTVTIAIKTEIHGSNKGEHIIGQGTVPLADGGPIVGPGPKGIDSVPILAAPGEYMLPANEVDAAGGPGGVERIRAMLRGGRRSGGAPAMAGATAAGGGAMVVHNTYQITVNVPPTANLAEVGRLNVEAIRAYEQRSGTRWRAA